MGVGTFSQPDMNSQNSAEYKAAIDNSIAVSKRFITAFAPRQSSPAAMAVTLESGFIQSGSGVSEVAQQTTATITAPVGNPRIDRVVVDRTTGVVELVAGTAAPAPVAPAIPAGKLGVAQVSLVPGQTAITNSSITDERFFPLNPSLLDSLTMSGQIREAKASSVTSASTVDFGVIAGNYVTITGTATITSLGTAQAGTRVEVKFDASLTLTHNAVSLILPTNANIITAAGDTASFRSEGSGNWTCTSYNRADGSAVSSTAGTNVQLFTASGTWVKPVGFSADAPVRLRAWGGGASGSHSGSGYNAGGGGGSFWERWVKLSDLAATETVTVGAGGIGVAYTGGQNGGDSSVGTLITAYGGTAGNTGNSNVGGAGGTPFGKSAYGTYTTPTTAQEIFGQQGYGGDGTNKAKHGGLYNGGGGGHGRATNSPGAGSLNGGGGGGGGGGAQVNGGVSTNAGNGGKGQATVVTDADGLIPGGGGGGRYAGASRPGHGARGQVEIIVFK